MCGGLEKGPEMPSDLTFVNNIWCNPGEVMTLPRWDGVKSQFSSGEKTIRGEFERLVRQYGVPREGSPALGAADSPLMPTDDILGNPRGGRPDISCFQQGVAK